ncbi:MAG: hypothetical protein RMK15_04560, partial [Chloroflexota bacterium]|nr:hypothetical protein [Chloroflexota bacterium]
GRAREEGSVLVGPRPGSASASYLALFKSGSATVKVLAQGSFRIGGASVLVTEAELPVRGSAWRTCRLQFATVRLNGREFQLVGMSGLPLEEAARRAVEAAKKAARA